MMNNLLFSTHWTAEEAEIILAFLDDLKAVISNAYEVDIHEMYQAEMERRAQEKEQTDEGNDDQKIV